MLPCGFSDIVSASFAPSFPLPLPQQLKSLPCSSHCPSQHLCVSTPRPPLAPPPGSFFSALKVTFDFPGFCSYSVYTHIHRYILRSETFSKNLLIHLKTAIVKQFHFNINTVCFKGVFSSELDKNGIVSFL